MIQLSKREFAKLVLKYGYVEAKKIAENFSPVHDVWIPDHLFGTEAGNQYARDSLKTNPPILPEKQVIVYGMESDKNL